LPPYIFVLSCTILVNGALLRKLGYYKPWYLFGALILLVGGVLMCKSVIRRSFQFVSLGFERLLTLFKARVDVNTSTGAIYGYDILLGLGAGAFAQSGFAIIQAVVAPEEMANGITFIVSQQSAPKWHSNFREKRQKLTYTNLSSEQIIGQLSGITFGLAIAGAVFVNDALSKLEALLPDTPPDQLQLFIAGTSSALLESLGDSVSADVLSAVVVALSKV
jgi:hypothetical protein